MAVGVLPRKAHPQKAARLRLDPGVAVIVAMFMWAVVPSAIQVTLATRPMLSVTETATQIGLASTAATICQFATYGTLAFSALANFTRIRMRPWLILYLAIWAAITVSSVMATGEFAQSSIVYVLLGFVVAGHPDHSRLLRCIGTLTGWLAVGSLALAVALPSAAFIDRSAAPDSKAILGSNLLAGPFYHSNSLGQMLAFGLPWVLMIRNRRVRWFTVAAVLLALVWSASRTSLLAAGIGLTVAVAWKAYHHLSRSSKMLTLPAMGLLYVALIPIGILMVATASDSSYTDRGSIWKGSLDAFQTNPLFGLGVDAYTALAEAGRVGSLAYHGHNMFVNALTIGGVVGASLLLVLYIVLLKRSWSLALSGRICAAIWAVIFVCIGWLEAPTTFYTLANMSWTLWVAMAIILANSWSRPKPVLVGSRA